MGKCTNINTRLYQLLDLLRVMFCELISLPQNYIIIKNPILLKLLE